MLAFLSGSVQSRSVPVGMATMAALGLGTAWSLLLLGWTGGLLHRRLRRWGAVVGGIVLIVLAAVTVLRATDAFHSVFGCPPAGGPATAPTSNPAACPQCAPGR